VLYQLSYTRVKMLKGKDKENPPVYIPIIQ